MNGIVHDFKTSLSWSKGLPQKDDISTLMYMIDSAISVVALPELDDRNGNDYRATLRDGAIILIDAKNRRAGCGKYWKQWPELALETWSVMPGGTSREKIGWTLCEKKQTDLILFKFDKKDCEFCFLVPYQILRIAFLRNKTFWAAKYKIDRQRNGNYSSEAIFVPANVVFAAMIEAQTAKPVVNELKETEPLLL